MPGTSARARRSSTARSWCRPPNGTTDFSVLQNELKGRSTKIVLVVFDLLYLNGYDLRKLPLVERKAHLKKLISGTDIQFSESFEVDGREMFAHACNVGLEGVVSKVRDSCYVSGRSNDWVKKTCAQRETLPIAGFALKENKFDGIYLGRQKGDGLVYAGKVDHGFDHRLGQGPAGPVEAADPQDPALHQEDRPQGHLGRAVAAGGDRVPGEVCRGKGQAPGVQGTARGPVMDIYDGAAWTEMDVDDLKAAIETGSSVEEAAEFLCRAGSVDDVARKTEELSLKAKVRKPRGRS